MRPRARPRYTRDAEVWGRRKEKRHDLRRRGWQVSAGAERGCWTCAGVAGRAAHRWLWTRAAGSRPPQGPAPRGQPWTPAHGRLRGACAGAHSSPPGPAPAATSLARPLLPSSLPSQGGDGCHQGRAEASGCYGGQPVGSIGDPASAWGSRSGDCESKGPLRAPNLLGKTRGRTHSSTGDRTLARMETAIGGDCRCHGLEDVGRGQGTHHIEVDPPPRGVTATVRLGDGHRETRALGNPSSGD